MFFVVHPRNPLLATPSCVSVFASTHRTCLVLYFRSSISVSIGYVDVVVVAVFFSFLPRPRVRKI